MRKIMTGVLMVATAASLTACGGGRKAVTHRTGLDEYAVARRAPLVVPPDFALNPPQPGAPRPQDADVSLRAQQTLLGNAPARPATDAENARDRIGAGPWFNAKGVKVADSVADLHVAMMMSLNKTTALDEKGNVVNGRTDSPNQHDIVTGSDADGRVKGMATCLNWTTDADMQGVVASVGHHDRVGGGADPTSWNAAHDSAGCSAKALVGTGGAGRIYCFAKD